MPSNEQRRAAAKRKLERRLERQAERARKRKQLTIAGSVVGVVVVIAAGVGIYFLTKGDSDKTTAAPDASLSSTPQVAPPAAPKPKAATVACTYTDAGPAAKPATKPEKTEVSTQDSPKVSIDTSQGPIGITLNAAASPCTANSFASLVQQGFYNGAPCHRLSTQGLKMLQCGDPSGTGKGGPGYQFANEYPTDQFAQGDPALQNPVSYQRGVVAMANAGPDTNGSQFFLMFGDSQLPPQYTIFGTVDEPGLATLDKIAAGGDDESMATTAGGGKPNLPVTFESARIG
ncbi:peptidylprolyl isomerase [Nocardia aurantia]|uniref:Peptidyl-prolyl cis-trans isomerase n=1 Tax=Nocardia aurantia TaxID=2585199 RepID=A0A7K0DTA8_9NOCA|nr:peptidylprolyl isomerase [Nocardia aurantia]MQY29010.1 putative peptidyl-prolyl cis-trans isomerase B [Nocardia aurantia]